MGRDLKKQFENNRHLILETVSRLFTKMGIMNTSFSDISKECKLSKGTIYYYYPSKDHLIYEVTDYHFKQVTDAIFIWIGKTSADFPLHKAIKTLFELIFETADKCKLHVCLLNEAIMGNEPLNKRFLEKYNEWKTMIEVGLLKISGPNDDFKKLSNAIILMLDGIIFMRSSGNDPQSIEDACTMLIGQSNK